MRLLALTVLCLTAPPSLRAQSRWPADQFAHQLVPGRPAPAPSCRAVTPVLAGDSLGPLHPGMSLSQLLRACPHVYLGWHFEEGIAEPAAAVRLGKVLALAILEDTSGIKARIYRIMTADTSAKTPDGIGPGSLDRKSTRLNSSHGYISYAVFCLKKKKNNHERKNCKLKHSKQERTTGKLSNASSPKYTRPRT